MKLISSLKKAIDTELMDVLNISSMIMNFMKPNLYKVCYSLKITNRHFMETMIVKSYIYAYSVNHAYYLYNHYIQTALDMQFTKFILSKEQFQTNIKVINTNLKYYTIPRIDNIFIQFHLDFEEFNYFHHIFKRFIYKSNKNSKKLLYNQDEDSEDYLNLLETIYKTNTIKLSRSFYELVLNDQLIEDEVEDEVEDEIEDEIKDEIENKVESYLSESIIEYKILNEINIGNDIDENHLISYIQIERDLSEKDRYFEDDINYDLNYENNLNDQYDLVLDFMRN